MYKSCSRLCHRNQNGKQCLPSFPYRVLTAQVFSRKSRLFNKFGSKINKGWRQQSDYLLPKKEHLSSYRNSEILSNQRLLTVENTTIIWSTAKNNSFPDVSKRSLVEVGSRLSGKASELPKRNLRGDKTELRL